MNIPYIMEGIIIFIFLLYFLILGFLGIYYTFVKPNNKYQLLLALLVVIGAGAFIIFYIESIH